MPTSIVKSWSRRLSVAVTVAAIGLTAACGGEESVSLRLSSQSDSGLSGKATLTPEGSETTVTVELSGAPAGPQPSHIHEGTCENPNPAPAFALENVEDGRAETTVGVSLEELLSGDYYVNVHKSDAEIETVVACGLIQEAPDADGGGYGGGGGY